MSVRVSGGPVRGRRIRGLRGDPLLAAGFRLIADPATGLAPGGYTCARDVPVWLPQADGSLASFASNVVPREWANGAWWYRTDPAWVNSCLWGDEQTAARGWVSGMSASVVGEDGLTAPHGGTYTKHTSPGSGSPHIYRVVAVTPGQSVNLSALVRMGTMPEESFRMAFYDATALAFISTQVVPNITRLAGGWSIVDTTITAPAGCSSMRVYPFRNGSAHAGGTFYMAAVNATGTAYRVPMTRATGVAVGVGNHTWAPTLSSMLLTLGSEYTLFEQYEVLSRTPSQFPPVAQLRVGPTGGSNITVGLFIHPNGNQYALVRDTADIYTQISGGAGATKTAFRVRAGSFRAASNGVLGPLGATGSAPSGLSALQIGRDGTGAVVAAMRIGRLGLHQTLGQPDHMLQSLSI